MFPPTSLAARKIYKLCLATIMTTKQSGNYGHNLFLMILSVPLNVRYAEASTNCPLSLNVCPPCLLRTPLNAYFDRTEKMQVKCIAHPARSVSDTVLAYQSLVCTQYPSLINGEGRKCNNDKHLTTPWMYV